MGIFQPAALLVARMMNFGENLGKLSNPAGQKASSVCGATGPWTLVEFLMVFLTSPVAIL